MLAEDLNLAPVLTFWNDVQPDEAKAPARDSLVMVEPDRAFHLIAYEQEPSGLGGTAALYFNLRSPIPYGENMVAGLLRAKEQGAWTEIEKPYVWDAPALLATDLVDSIQFAPNLFSWWMKDDFASCRELNWGDPGISKRILGSAAMAFGYRIFTTGCWTAAFEFPLLTERRVESTSVCRSVSATTGFTFIGAAGFPTIDGGAN